MLTIRDMTEEDLDAVQEIEQVSVPIPWSKESYCNEIHNRWSRYFVCEADGRIVGYSGIWNVFDESNIMTIVVDQAFRKQGIGRRLMEAMEDSAREQNGKTILLEVRPSNEAALRLYASLGYVEISRRTAYYPNNQEDALILCKKLDVFPSGMDFSGAVLLGK